MIQEYTRKYGPEKGIYHQYFFQKTWPYSTSILGSWNSHWLDPSRSCRSSPAEPPLGTAVGPPDSPRTPTDSPRCAARPTRGAILSAVQREHLVKDAKMESEKHQDLELDVVFLLVRIWELTQPATVLKYSKWRVYFLRFFDSA